MSFAVFRKPLTVKRHAAGSYVGGFWTEGSVNPLTIQASVQPASQADMQLLPEGRRITSAYRLYTDDTLLLAKGNQQADRVVVQGEDYEVLAEAHWDNGVLPHKSYVVSRIVEGTE